MASIFKDFTRKDIVSSKTVINEALPITGTLVSGTYNDDNIKNYSHGMFQTVYDFPYLSSSANPVFDITAGYSANSTLSSSTNVQNSKKINIYNQMAQVLVGHDVDGSILDFDEDGDIVAGGTKMREAVFLNYKRLLKKDEIKKGTFSLSIFTEGSVTGSRSASVDITDAGASTDFRVNSPSGEYGFLTASSGHFPGYVGLIYYQAGVAVLTSSLFKDGAAEDGLQDFGAPTSASTGGFDSVFTGSTLNNLADGLRARWEDSSVQNVVEINSTFYNVSVDSNEFNYSANPTYLNGSRIRNKEVSQDQPASYITTVGLYSADNVLLGVAKISEPIKKTPAAPLNIRVRTDF